MQFRFRYLAPDGRQVQVESVEALRALLRSGRVAPETLLYDALTSEWAPVRAHAVVRPVEDAQEVGTEKPAGGAAGAELDLPGLDLTLSPEDETPSTDETVRELLKEREREADATLDADNTGFNEPSEGSGVVVVEAGVDEPAAGTRDGDRPATMSGEPSRRSVAGAGGDPTRAASAPAAAWGSARGAGRPPMAPRPRRRSVRPLLAVGSAGLLALLIYAVGWSDDRPDPPADVAILASAPAGPAAQASSAVSLLGASEAVALGDMVEALDSLRGARGIDDVPRDWLEGIYLSEASRYPEVRAYWERYDAFVEEVRQRETALFRQSFVRRLEAQGVTGSMVPMRLARAIRIFEESQPSRDTVYDAMADLARTSLDLHDLLVEREGDIEYDPVLPKGVSRDPVVEAVMDDPLLRESMWSLLDRIFYDLSVLSGGGAGTRAALTESSLDGIRATGGL